MLEKKQVNTTKFTGLLYFILILTTCFDGVSFGYNSNYFCYTLQCFSQI